MQMVRCASSLHFSFRSVEIFRFAKATFNRGKIAARGRDAKRRLLLEAVSHIDCVPQTYSVHRAVGVARPILDHFQNARSAKAFQRLRFRVFLAYLRLKERRSSRAVPMNSKSRSVVSMSICLAY
jgi:ABC-type branched-subunit amino acid transport system ATPase component